MRQLNALDRLFLTQESTRVPLHISFLLFYTQETAPGGTVRLRDILRQFAARAPRIPVLHERVVDAPLGLDNPYWVGSQAPNVEAQLHHIALPQPGDWRQLCILVARLHARAIDRARPLWEGYVIEGLDGIDFLPRGSFAILLKLHHAAVDGMAALEAIAGLHDETPRRVSRAQRASSPEERPPTTATMLRRAAWHGLGLPLRWARLFSGAAPAAARLVSLWRARDDDPRPRGQRFANTRFNRPISGFRVVECTFFTLEELQAARAAVPGSTLNDVVVTIIGGAMRSYLIAHGELGPVSPLTVAPLSIREAGEREFGGNLVSAMAFPVHTDIERPLERLAAVHQASRSAKAFAQALGPRASTAMLEAIPAPLAAVNFMGVGTRLLTASGIATPVNTVITNVAGPKNTLYLAGARMVAMAGFGPILDSMGLFHAIMSYDGTVTIAINSCRELMPDPAFYAECIRSSWRELQKAAALGAARSTRRARAAAPRRSRATAAGRVRRGPAPRA